MKEEDCTLMVLYEFFLKVVVGIFIYELDLMSFVLIIYFGHNFHLDLV